MPSASKPLLPKSSAKKTPIRKSSSSKSPVSAPPAPAPSVSKRLPNPHASIRISSFPHAPFFVVVDASLSKNRIADFGFETNGPPAFISILVQGFSYFTNLSQDEAEIFSLALFSKKFSVSPAENVFVLYAYTAIQDTIARLPFDDPLSRAVNKISRLHDEFPIGDLTADDED